MVINSRATREHDGLSGVLTNGEKLMPTLDFKGKQFVYAHHLSVPFKQLNIVADKSLPKDNKPSLDDNLIIYGDNLHALKALLPKYAGKIKCIYIDPPYNTGNEDWCYNDNVNSPLMKAWLNNEGNPVDKEDLERHDKWLCMMWPRLQLLRELLSEDGVIFVSIDDNERHRLRSIMDEIFGEDNFTGEFVWERKKKPSFLDRNMGIVTEYILSYAKNKRQSPSFIEGLTTKGKKYPINNAGNGLKVLSFPKGSVLFRCPDQIFRPQDMSEGNIKTILLDDLMVVNGKNVDVFRLEGEWRYSQETINQIISKNEQIVISRNPFRPNHIKNGDEPKKIKNLLSRGH